RIGWSEATWSKPLGLAAGYRWPQFDFIAGNCSESCTVRWNGIVTCAPYRAMDPPGPDTGPYRTHAVDDGRCHSVVVVFQRTELPTELQLTDLEGSRILE